LQGSFILMCIICSRILLLKNDSHVKSKKENPAEGTPGKDSSVNNEDFLNELKKFIDKKDVQNKVLKEMIELLNHHESVKSKKIHPDEDAV
jgi:hypothetical protein